MDPIASQLVIEEFNQIHEHMRQREVAMNHLLNIMVTGTTTLLAAIAAYVFRFAAGTPGEMPIQHSYLFLLIMPLPILGLAMLAAHRHDIYRMGYYVTVFFEERYGGAEWGIRSFRFRELVRGESHDPVIFIFWSLVGAAAVLFLFSLAAVDALVAIHSLALVPFLLAMAMQHKSFTKDRRDLKATWLKVLEEQGSHAASRAEFTRHGDTGKGPDANRARNALRRSRRRRS